jgi:phosphatidylinositol alpha-1,6-mannosyltransferase
MRRVPVVQTVASPPASLVESSFFGDIVVAQSRHTRDRIVAAFEHGRAPRVEVIPPPVATVMPRNDEVLAELGRTLGLPEHGPVFVYPGDLEVSAGARTVADAVAPLRELFPTSITVFACRAKTERAPEIRRALASRLDPRAVRFVEQVDLPALIQLASVIVFPVEDLRGKVDLPISLLEAMQLRVPVVAWNYGPLSDLEGAELIPPFDVRLLVDRVAHIVRDPAHRQAVIGAQRQAVASTYDASRIASAYESLYDALLAR